MEISIAAEQLFTIGGFPVTNSFLVAVLANLGLAIVSFVFFERIEAVPRGFQNVAEAIFEGLYSLVDGVMHDREATRRFLPLIATIFIFLVVTNLAGIMPGAESVGFARGDGEHASIIPFVRGAAADLNTTIALSLISVFTVQFIGITTLGLRGYGAKFFVSPFKKPYVLGTFIGLLELISEAAKLLSFSFRLFGNIFAGEVLLTVLFHLVPYIIPLPFFLFELFVCVIQAFIFSLLTIVFIKMAITPAHAEAL